MAITWMLAWCSLMFHYLDWFSKNKNKNKKDKNKYLKKLFSHIWLTIKIWEKKLIKNLYIF